MFARVFVAFWGAALLMVVLAVIVTSRNFSNSAIDPMRLTAEAQSTLLREGRAGLVQWLVATNRRLAPQRVFVLDAGRRTGASESAFPPGTAIADAGGLSLHVMFDPPPRRAWFDGPYSPLEQAAFALLALLISAAAALWVASSVGRPLQDLSRMSRELATGRLDARPAAQLLERRDEFGELSRDFNQMAARLTSLITSRQYLLRELSHEMRSPLARLRIALDLAQGGHERSANALAQALLECQRLENLAQSVLVYARLEQEQQPRVREAVNLGEVVTQAIADVAYQYPLSGTSLQLEAGADNACVSGDPLLLHIMVENLVRNALLHGAWQPPPQIGVSRGDSELVLTVRDHGSGVPESELTRIFQPFVRLAHHTAARSGNEDGSGLGLSIVARIASLHGGQCSAANHPDGGLRVIVRLPLADNEKV